MSAPGIHTTDRQRPVTVAEMDEPFDGVMRALEVLAKAIQAHDQRFDAHDRRFDAHDRRFDALEEKLDKLLDHFGLR